jgi:hypothetical protein
VENYFRFPVFLHSLVLSRKDRQGWRVPSVSLYWLSAY